MTVLRTPAPAKINLTLEILGKREDGFHDLISVVQTLDLADDLRLGPARDVDPVRSVQFQDESGRPLAKPAGEIIARAWSLLSERSEQDLPGCVRVTKRLPIAGGLGGGSSNAAAFLRLANAFWELRLLPEALSELAAELGSDVPLFLHGGALLMDGRGERITELPDAAAAGGWAGLLYTPELPLPDAKTATMFSALRPRHFAGGERSTDLAAKLQAGEAPSREDLFNTFDTVVGEVLIGVAGHRRRFAAAARAVPLLAGAGPSLFLLGSAGDADGFPALAERLQNGGGTAHVVRPLSRAPATLVMEGEPDD